MKQNETATAVRGLRKFVPSHKALAWAALIAAAAWLTGRNNGPHGTCPCSPGLSAGQRTAGDRSQLAPRNDARTPATPRTSAAQAADVVVTTGPSSGTSDGLPRLLDLGAGKCIPCKMMTPILGELRDEYEGTMDVEFVDVGQHPELATKYSIESIPTQIFLDKTGKELFRHKGFFAKEDILAKWKELGVDLNR